MVSWRLRVRPSPASLEHFRQEICAPTVQPDGSILPKIHRTLLLRFLVNSPARLFWGHNLTKMAGRERGSRMSASPHLSRTHITGTPGARPALGRRRVLLMLLGVFGGCRRKKKKFSAASETRAGGGIRSRNRKLVWPSLSRTTHEQWRSLRHEQDDGGASQAAV